MKRLEIEGDHIIKIAEDVDLSNLVLKYTELQRKSRTEGISITRAIGYLLWRSNSRRCCS